MIAHAAHRASGVAGAPRLAMRLTRQNVKLFKHN
jgi:hypothetical protein